MHHHLHHLLLFLLAITTLSLATPYPNPAWDVFTPLPIHTSTNLHGVTIEGNLPEYAVNKSVYRLGPAYNTNPLSENPHLFDGLGFLQLLHFDSTTHASYRNQFVRSTPYNMTAKLPVVSKNSPNTGVTIRRVKDDEVMLANTGITISNAFDSTSLNTTAAPYVYERDDIIDLIEAPSHAHTDNGVVYHYAVDFSSSPPQYVTYKVENNQRIKLGTVAPNPLVGVPMFAHSFGLTQHYMVLGEQPVTYGREGWSSFKYIPALGTTWRVISRTTGEQVAEFTSKAVGIFHHVNSYEDSNGDVVVDFCGYNDFQILDALYLENLLNHPEYEYQNFTTSRIMRVRLPMSSSSSSSPSSSSSSVEVTVVGPALPMEMPTISYELYNTKPYRYTYGCTQSKVGWWDGVLKVDVTTGGYLLWEGDEGTYPNEPLFLANPNGNGDEDDGVVISQVRDIGRNNTFFVVLDAKTMKEVARVTLNNIRIPVNFHGRIY